MNKKYFNEKNQLVESELNITFEQVLRLQPEEVRDWLSKLRDEARRIWDEEGCPPALTEKPKKKLYNRLRTFRDLNFYLIKNIVKL